MLRFRGLLGIFVLLACTATVVGLFRTNGAGRPLSATITSQPDAMGQRGQISQTALGANPSIAFTSVPQPQRILVYSTRATGTALRATDFDTNLPAILAQDGHTASVSDRASMPTLSAAILSNYDQLWFISTETPAVLSAPEIQAIQDFHNAGKGIMVISDGCWYTAPANQFSPAFGVQFVGNRCCDCNHCGGNIGCLISTSGFPQHEIWNGVSQIQANLNEGDLAVVSTGQIIATDNNINMVAVGTGAGGRVAWDATVYRFSDATAHPNLAITYADNPRYVRNVAIWLSGGGQPTNPHYLFSIDPYDASLASVQGINFSGTLVDLSGNGVPGVVVGLDNPVSLTCHYSTTDGYGKFSIDLPPQSPEEAGCYMYSFFTPNYGTMGHVPVTYGAPVTVTENDVNQAILNDQTLASILSAGSWDPELAISATSPPKVVNVWWDDLPSLAGNTMDDKIRYYQAYNSWARAHNMEKVTIIEGSPGDLEAYNRVRDIVRPRLEESFVAKLIMRARANPIVALAFAGGTVCALGTGGGCYIPIVAVVGADASRVFIQDAIDSGYIGCEIPVTVEIIGIGFSFLVVGTGVSAPYFNPSLATEPGRLGASLTILKSAFSGTYKASQANTWYTCNSTGELSTASIVGESNDDGTPFKALVVTSNSTVLEIQARCPVVLELLDPLNRKIGLDGAGEPLSEIPRGYYTGVNDDPQTLAIIDPEHRYYRLNVVGTDVGTYGLTLRLISHGHVSERVLEGSATLGVSEDYYVMIDNNQLSVNDTPFPALSGHVVFDGNRGLYGVNLDIQGPGGDILYSVRTDNSGYYHVESIPNGEYSIAVVTPLGYRADQETKQFTVNNVPVSVDFALTKLDVTPKPRTRAYWATQLQKALQAKPQDYTIGRFSRFAGLINKHFNQNEINPVDFYTVPQPATQQDSLNVLKQLLCLVPTNSEPFAKRLGKADLMALMLNVVSGKIHQMAVISRDGATVTKAITYCDLLLNDGIVAPDYGEPDCHDPFFPYLRADVILTLINLGLSVPRGMIPSDIIEIAYTARHEKDPLPKTFTMSQNNPNPFNPTTRISFALPERAFVRLLIYDIAGRLVTNLVEDTLDGGIKEVVWDGRDAQGNLVSSGVYFYRLTAGDKTLTKKMVLLK